MSKPFIVSPWRRRHALRLAVAESVPRFDVSAAEHLDNADELARLKPGFVESLSASFGLLDLAGRFSPVLLENNTVAIFALADYVGADQVDALAAEIIARGLIPANPARYIVSAPLLLALARGQINVQSIRSGGHGQLHVSKTALGEVFHDLVSWAVRHSASDIHLNVKLHDPESEVRYTVAGRYVAPERFMRMPTTMLLDMLAVAWMSVRGGNGAVFDPMVEQQGSLERSVEGMTVLLRWSSLAAESGPSVCLRVLRQYRSSQFPGLAELGYLPDQVELIQRVMRSEEGAVVFAGNVGSGKSTSLAALIASMPSERKVVTLEDPVEYFIPGAIQNSVSRNLDADAHSLFAAKLRALKRSGMNDVLLGEIRDVETGRAFMDLASSGVAVFTTVHAPSVSLITERLASDFIQVSRDFLVLPGLFRLRAYQALLPQLCTSCSLPVTDVCAEKGRFSERSARSSQWLNLVSRLYECDASLMRVRNPHGCKQCCKQDTPSLNGYQQRVLVAEFIESSLELHQQRSAMMCGVQKALAGAIDPRDIEARFHAFETESLMRNKVGVL